MALAVAAPDSDTPSVTNTATPTAPATAHPPRCGLTRAASRDRPGWRATRARKSWCSYAAYSQYRVPQADCQLSSQFANISRMVPDADTSSGESTTVGLGAALRRAWLGYQLRLDAAMVDAGFGDRRFPDGRVLRVCAGEAGSTISAIGRELGITRQGASKVVAELSDRGYVVVADSSNSKREKSVGLTPLGVDYLAHQRVAARAIEDELRAELGNATFTALGSLLAALDAGDGVRLRAYLRRSSSI